MQVGAYEAAKVIEVTSDARRVTIDGLVFRGDTDAGGTQMDAVIQIGGPSKCEIKNCFIMAQTSGAVLTFTSAGSTDVYACWVHENYIEASSTSGIIDWTTDNNAGHALILSDNMFKVSTDSADPIVDGTTTIWSFNNLTVNQDGESGKQIDMAVGATS